MRKKGKLLVGNVSWIWTTRHFSENYFIYHTTTIWKRYENWGINLDDIKNNGEILPHIKTSGISIDFGFILSEGTYKKRCQ